MPPTTTRGGNLTEDSPETGLDADVAPNLVFRRFDVFRGIHRVLCTQRPERSCPAQPNSTRAAEFFAEVRLTILSACVAARL